MQNYSVDQFYWGIWLGKDPVFALHVINADVERRTCYGEVLTLHCLIYGITLINRICR